MPQTISQINIYPLKSAAPISLESSLLTSTGFENDRRLMLVDEAGVCITAREFPQLLLIYTQIKAQEYQFSYLTDSLRLSSKSVNNEEIRVNVHGTLCDATRLSPDADQWFSNALGLNCQLVSIMDGDVRNTAAQSGGFDSDVTSFADEYALLLISTASLADLNQRLDGPVGMRNFRPNLVVEGTGAFAEDGWSRIRIGETELRVTEKCQRCKLTTINPETAQAREDKEPLKTLLKYRRDESGSGVIFGVYLAPVGKPGTIRLNDEVIVES